MGGGGVFWHLDDGGATKKERLMHKRGEVRFSGSGNANGGSHFAAFGDLGGKNHAIVNGEINGQKEGRNLEQIQGVGDNWAIGPRSGPPALRPNNGRFGVKANKGSWAVRKPPDEVASNQLHDSAELKLAMEGLDCDLERNPEMR
ncbi:hypothetical protein GOBAR_DD23256 [Gossypium barbadense]|nr:hypothetical protein GOBAR_DD23256 [Gossypium barbadense]